MSGHSECSSERSQMLVEQAIARGELLETIAARLGLSVDAVYGVADRMDRLWAEDLPQPCGTIRAYWRHCRRGEPIDDACREAHREYNRARSEKERRTRGMAIQPTPQPCGTPAAYNRHRAKGEPIDDACRAAIRAYSREYRSRTYVPRREPLRPCGTIAAVRRHQRAGEPLCDRCRHVEMARLRDQKRRRRERQKEAVA